MALGVLQHPSAKHLYGDCFLLGHGSPYSGIGITLFWVDSCLLLAQSKHDKGVPWAPRPGMSCLATSTRERAAAIGRIALTRIAPNHEFHAENLHSRGQQTYRPPTSPKQPSSAGLSLLLTHTVTRDVPLCCGVQQLHFHGSQGCAFPFCMEAE